VFPSPDGSALSYTRNVPVGVVVAVLTWNFPLLNLGYKLGPILATGCACVIKPAEVRLCSRFGRGKWTAFVTTTEVLGEILGSFC